MHEDIHDCVSADDSQFDKLTDMFHYDSMVLHRPYVRLDPSAYPESSEICLRAAHILLMAYTVGSYARASIFWNWWTMSYRVSVSLIWCYVG